MAQCSERSQSAQPATALVLDAVQDTVKIGLPIVVKLTVTNKSDHDVLLFKDTRDLENRVDVRDGKGNLAPETRLGSRQNGHLDPNLLTPAELIGKMICATMKAGESWILNLNVQRLYDLTQPGKYAIQVERDDPDSTKAVKSNPVTITLVK